MAEYVCVRVCVCVVLFFRVHKFYFTDDNTIIFLFRFVSDGVFPNRIAFHVRVIRMSIETTAIAFAIATATATATLHMQWI